MDREMPLCKSWDREEDEPSWILAGMQRIAEIFQLELTPDELQECETLRAKFLVDHALFTRILSALSTRKMEGELPMDPTIAQETLVQFLERRNLQECQRLQKSCQAFLARMGAEEKHVSKDVGRWMEDSLTLLILERRKASYTEQEVCPLMFARALEQARGDVYQFLIGKRAERKLRRKIPLMNGIKVHYRDELNYLLEGHDSTSAGDIRVQSGTGTMTLRVPSQFSPIEEARIYHVSVHEYVHSVSIKTARRFGLHVGDNDGFDMLNEAVTELTAAAIVREHILQGKVRFKGQQLPELSALPYRNEIVAAMNSIMRYVSLTDLQDAMLNRRGLGRLIRKLDQQFKGEGQKKLREFARNIERLYEPAPQRKIPHAWQTVLPLEHYRQGLQSVMNDRGDGE